MTEVNARVLAEILTGDVPEADALHYALGHATLEPHPIGGFTEVEESPTGVITFTREIGYFRLDGPAIVTASGGATYYTDRGQITYAQFLGMRGIRSYDPLELSFTRVEIGVKTGLYPHAPLTEALAEGAPIEWAIAFAESVSKVSRR